MPATHAFYSEAMGFRLAKVIKQTMPRSWAKHFFYDLLENPLAPVRPYFDIFMILTCKSDCLCKPT
jgi:catechol 2,3-dioxygenase-like lactoylglutathione lyase family enzyme